ncbi:MAG: PfkB family carbohydrate kinase [Bacteroidales bacterium]|nr:PfkB family carbohydrate kinase [Bacteroidales bacterium]
MRKIIGIGETVLDIIFRGETPVSAVPGGSTFNSIVSLGRTAGRDFSDVRVSMVTEVGDDRVGDIVISFLEQNRVQSAFVTRKEGKQSNISLAFLDSNNDAQYEFFRDKSEPSLQQNIVDSLIFNKNDIVITGSFFSVDPAVRKHTAGLLGKAYDAGAIIYYDVNFRKNHIADIPVLLPNILENMDMSDFVRGSSEDFGYLFGSTDPEDIYGRYIAGHCRNFICTGGGGPVHIFTNGRHIVIPVGKVETVSTIGAGDSFNAGFLYSVIALGIGKDDVGSLDEGTLESMAGTASRFASNVCRSLYNYVDEDFTAGN